MAQVGQTTPSGGREFTIYPQQAVLRGVTVPAGFVPNHIGIWVREQTTPSANDLKAALYTSAGILVAESNVLTTPITSTSTHALKQVTFPVVSASASGNYLIAVSAGPGTSGVVVVQGQNGPGGVPVSFFTDPAFYPTFPSDISALWETTATRSWDLYLDYTESGGGGGASLSNQKLILLGVG